MVLSDVCIRRPVFATVLSLVVVLIGLVAYERLSVREYPNIDPPVVNVRTEYKGASAEIIETQVTKILEDSLSGIEGIDFITSVSRAESSQITINFVLNREPDSAAADVRDRVSRMRGRLPDEIDEPIIQKVEADAQAMLYLSFSSDRHSPLEISDFIDRYVTDQIQTVQGVAEVRIFGERRYAMRIWLDPARLAAYQVTAQDVENALRNQNVEVPSGRIESVQREFTVLSQTDLRTTEEFENLILRDSGGYLVRLRDVGRVALGPADERRVVRFNGRNAISTGVIKQATANPLDVSTALRADLPKIEASLPDGMSVTVAYDKSVFIEESIKNVYTTIAEAIVLVVLIIFAFLRSFRATLVPLVTIPVALIGSFGLMFLFGFSINTLTLLSMVLAIGLVVDDAIVMLENIYRHVESGMKPLQAAFTGSREIAFAVLAMTLTLAAVYVPIGFMTGKTGRLFTEFAWTLAGAVLVSGFVALTLSPMMAAKLLRQHERHGRLYRLSENALIRLTNGYRRLLVLSLKVRPLVLLAGLVVAGSSYFLFVGLKSELAPIEDQGTIVTIYRAPEGATIEYTDTYARQVEEVFRTTQEIDRSFVTTGFPTVSNGIGFARLTDWDDRTRTSQAIADEMRDKLNRIPGLLAFPTLPPPLGQSVRERPVNFIIQTSQPYAELEQMVDAMMERARNSPILTNVDIDLQLNKPQIRVEVDRDKVEDVGVNVQTLGRTLETLLGGRQVTRFKREGEQYDVIVQLADVDRSNPTDLERIYVRGRGGEMIQLSNLVRIQETVAPRELNHFNQLRSATITANLGQGYALGDALTFLDDVAAEVLPDTARVEYGGQSREYREASAAIFVTFLLALAFIYLVLSAQFESFIDPFIIMLTVPLSITGGLLALYLNGLTLNIYSQVGLVTLIGLITKHGILIVEFANQAREQGRSVHQAAVASATLRLRPILMTTGAMVLGAMPLAIATGAGAESRRAIGWVVVGGLLVGTFFTLFVIPTVYTLIRRERRSEAATTEGVPHPAE